jgi:hydrogenase nickel incorporation protein HypA/HybF
MHELSIAHGIVQAVRQHLPVGERRAVKSVTLRLGDFARLAPESLELCFEMASEGTAVQGAKLKITNVPIRCDCKKCGSGFEDGRFISICPNCGSAEVELISGDEMDVVEVELSESA